MDTKYLIAEKIKEAVPDLELSAITNLLEVPKNSDMGDWAFPAFTLAKSWRKAPQMIASEIAEKIDSEDFEKVEAVGPYINFFLNKNKLSADLIAQVISQGSDYGRQDLGEGGSVTIDMSSPNIAKPFSIGHLRSTVIGDSLSMIFQKLGYQTIKINHLGDWGKQFGLLILAYKKWGQEEAVKAHPIKELLELYVRINAEVQNHPELDDQAREWFRKLEAGDEEALELWQWFREESLLEFSHLYDQLGVTFDSYNGEAFYNDKMAEIIDLLTANGLLQESQGAQVVNLEKYGMEHPALIKKSDGATLYITRDLATALYRKRQYQFAKSIYVVGNEQAAHFKQLKAILKEMGYDWSDDIVYVPFGLVTKGGKKLSTRKGNIILLEPTLAEAIKRAADQINAKNPDLANKDAVAHAVGVGAIKFYDLKSDRMNGYDFDLEAMVSFEGETGPYVQYAHARIQSILRKAAFSPDAAATYSLNDKESWDIIKLIQAFPDVINRAADRFEPSLIAKHAIHLAQSFNKYYAHTRIIAEDAERDSRLALCYATATVLKEALRLLGVEAPNEM
ncbi:arginine--tRNA ligase [Streptococcus pantholopis]|uniref:Arginine--tRNA ligase n=1 Tax=Streptococcus pantholopis TaxID=1811193 RepID=A0A172Q9J8_9STRE|nr:arginine--tRNA ligase [Streptococcus pantholopis]AND80183.1 arginine--tRNA ligase [Streptococcus pantholopis]